MAKQPPRDRTIRRAVEGDPALKAPAQRRPDKRQRPLPFDPMPARIEPCLALLASKVPTGPDWSYEVKWDGYRLAIHIEPDRVSVITRGGHDWTDRFPGIAVAARDLADSAIIDGEAVVLDAQGRSDFSALQASLGGRGGKKRSDASVLYAFDLLYLNGHDLTGLGQGERRQILEDLIEHPDGVVRMSIDIEADGNELLKNACALGLEGIIAKHRDRPYRSGRTGDWLKIKCVRSETFLVVGYEPSTTMPGAIASLLLAAWKGKELVYVGNVGTGFKDQVARDLRRQLDDLRIANPVVPMRGRGLVFAQPALVAEIEFRAWTEDGKLRHASFKGLRDAADHTDVFQIAE